MKVILMLMSSFLILSALMFAFSLGYQFKSKRYLEIIRATRIEVDNILKELEAKGY